MRVICSCEFCSYLLILVESTCTHEEPLPVATHPIYSVSDLVGEMRQLMERSYPEIWIEGELSSLSKPASGHLYFSLKDESSQLRCAMFRNRASLSRYVPKAGDLVKVRAKISVYTARGDLQCIVQHIEDAGAGLLQRQFEELKQKLAAEGLFAAERKQLIPSHPRRIGLITSPSGAAVHDILTTLARRHPGIPVTLFPAVVQGEGAAQSLRNALADAHQDGRCDVLVLTRGGGSMEDLWCFNDEGLACDIYAATIPIVSAVGHEVDITIADLAADLRAPTPTSAAELISPEKAVLEGTMIDLAKRLRYSFQRQLQVHAQLTDQIASRLAHPRHKLAIQQQNISGLSNRLQLASRNTQNNQMARFNRQRQRLMQQTPTRYLKTSLSKTIASQHQLQNAIQRQLRILKQKHAGLGGQLDIVSPLSTLQRGFAVARDANANIVRDATQLAAGQRLQIALSKGEVECDVVDVSAVNNLVINR